MSDANDWMLVLVAAETAKTLGVLIALILVFEAVARFKGWIK